MGTVTPGRVNSHRWQGEEGVKREEGEGIGGMTVCLGALDGGRMWIAAGSLEKINHIRK